MKSLLLLLSLLVVTQASSQQEAKGPCFKLDPYRPTPTWICRYTPDNVKRGDLMAEIIREFRDIYIDSTKLDISESNFDNSVYIRTTLEYVAKGIEAKLPLWDNNDEIIKTLDNLKIRVDFYVMSETEVTGFRAGISQVEKGVNQTANSETDGEDSQSGATALTSNALSFLAAGGSAGLTAVIGKSLDNLSLYLGRKRQKSSLRVHRDFVIDHPDREYFETSQIAEVDITAPTNNLKPQFVDLGVRISGRLRLTGGSESRLVNVDHFHFEWTREETADDVKNNRYPKFEHQTYNDTWILGVPRFIATAEVNEYSSSKGSNLLSIEKENRSVKKKLAIVATVFRSEDNIDSGFGKYELHQEKNLSQEESEELPKGKTDCNKLSKSLTTKVVRDQFGKARLLLKSSPEVLTTQNKETYLYLTVASKGSKARKKKNKDLLKDIAYHYQTAYDVIPENETSDFLELTIKAELGKKNKKVCKFKRTATYNLENGVFRFED